MNATTEQITQAMTAAGFALTPWKHQKFIERVFGECGVSKEFERYTMRGLIEHNAAENTLSVIAVMNLVRGNGAFRETIIVLEHIAIEHAVTLRVVQFENMRLASWFSRRPQWKRGCDDPLGEHAVFCPAPAPATL